MHGYDSNGMQPMHPTNMTLGHNAAPPEPIANHPDSTDSYVTYLESDESMQNSP